MDRIEQAAHRLIFNFGTSSPFDLCEQLGIPVLHMELPEHINGFTFQKNGKNTIVLNFKQQNDRYICAHELLSLIHISPAAPRPARIRRPTNSLERRGAGGEKRESPACVQL